MLRTCLPGKNKEKLSAVSRLIFICDPILYLAGIPKITQAEIHNQRLYIRKLESPFLHLVFDLSGDLSGFIPVE
jgi:hypothetical protein